MPTPRIALANLRYPATPDESVTKAEQAIAQAAQENAEILCFPECFIPGYRGMGKTPPPPDKQFLEHAWTRVAAAAAKARITVILCTERIASGATPENGLLITALVIHPDRAIPSFQDTDFQNSDFQDSDFQDKVQLDPSEDGPYTAGSGRRIFHSGPLTFGIAICHEGWRYPETVRWAARQGAHIVFHPQFHQAEPGSYRPTTYADPANTFHEKAALCRAAENTCYFATVNYASEGSPTTSAVVNPDGTLLCYQPYGQDGLLIAEIDLAEATGLLARRWRDV